MAQYIDEFRSPWVQAWFDVGNVVLYGYPEDRIRSLGKRTVKVHLKDFKKGAKGGRLRLWGEPRRRRRGLGRRTPGLCVDIGYAGSVIAELEGGDAAYLKEVAARVDRFLAGQKPVLSFVRGASPLGLRHAPSLAAAPAHSGRVARSRRSLARRCRDRLDLLVPVLFRIGSFEITSFGVMVALGALAGLWLFRRELARAGLPDAALDAAVYGLVGGLARRQAPLRRSSTSSEGSFFSLLPRSRRHELVRRVRRRAARRLRDHPRQGAGR